MDTQEKKKRGAIGLGAMSALLGVTAKGAHNFAKNMTAAQKVSKVGRVPLVVKDAKLARNILGVGAVGTGLGSAVLAAKYFKNKKSKIVPRAPTDAEMKGLLKGEPDGPWAMAKDREWARNKKK